MPRQHAKRNGAEAPEEEGPRSGTFTNSAGETYEIRGISPWALDTVASQLEDEWKAQGRQKPTPPTYQVPIAGGESETHPHDESTLDTDEDRAAWAAYQKDLAEWKGEERDRFMRNILMDGVATPLPTDEAWIARQRFMGRRVPEDALEREMYWRNVTIIRSAQDAADLMTAVLALTGISEEKIRTAENSFRGALEEPGRPAAA